MIFYVIKMSFYSEGCDFNKYEIRNIKNSSEYNTKYSTKSSLWYFSDFNGSESDIQGDWYYCEMNVPGHIYNIMVNFGGPDKTPILIKPTVKYENYEFEQIFGFRSHCSNWNPHKMVSIRKRDGSDVSINTISYEEVIYVKKDKENGELRTV